MNAVKVANPPDRGRCPGVGLWRFTYTKGAHETKLGPIELSVKEKETVNVPDWAGAGAILIGGALLLFGSRSTVRG